MLSLSQKYKPVVSTPFGRVGYREIAPCKALQPYIRCFWSERYAEPKILVIPDTCMDIIFGCGWEAHFCTMDDRSFYSEQDGAELFGIRFYAWTAGLFSRRNFSESSGGAFPAEEWFDGIETLNCAIQCAETFDERVFNAEKWLLKRLDALKADNNLFNAVDFILDNRGAVEISELCAYTAVSPRRLERLFARSMGVSPKTFSGLARYQLLWREMAAGAGFNAADAVEKYGYSDQAHMLNDFRRRHLMNPKQALDYANKYAKKF